MLIQKRALNFALASVFLFFLGACSPLYKGPPGDIAPGLEYIDEHTLSGPKSFLTDFSPLNDDGTINVVVEIPAGTSAKWEVSKPEGRLVRDFKRGEPRVVGYLPYPGNYGMIPGTVMPEEIGGDGDPLDAVILGPAVPRGSVVRARIIGVLRLTDKGEKDDKIIATMEGTPLHEAGDMAELEEKFPGAASIIETWFTGYKGPGKVVSGGYGGPGEARDILELSMEAFGKK